MYHTCNWYGHHLQPPSCAYLVHWMSIVTSGEDNDQDDWGQVLLEKTADCRMLVVSRLLLLKPYFDDMHKLDCLMTPSWILFSPVYDPCIVYKISTCPIVVEVSRLLEYVPNQFKHYFYSSLIIVTILMMKWIFPLKVTQKPPCNFPSQED